MILSVRLLRAQNPQVRILLFSQKPASSFPDFFAGHPAGLRVPLRRIAARSGAG
jgi:hypothetical protein